jgi:hypothetical protein
MLILLDTRNYLAFGGQHIQDSWHLDLNGNFPTFAGWVLPTDKDILLIADDDQKRKRLWCGLAGWVLTDCGLPCRRYDGLVDRWACPQAV